MKKIILILILILTASLFCKERTLIRGNTVHGGYGAPQLKIASMNDETHLFVGGKGAWIINHTFALGLAGYGKVTEWNMPNDSILHMGYGGMYMEFIIMSDNLLHVTVETLMGVGGVNIDPKHYDAWNGPVIDDESDDTDVIFVIEPGINAELNVAPFLRLNMGIGYSIYTDVEMEHYNLSDDDLNGLTGNIALKFGKF